MCHVDMLCPLSLAILHPFTRLLFVAFTAAVPSRVTAHVPSIHTRRSSEALVSLLRNVTGNREGYNNRTCSPQNTRQRSSGFSFTGRRGFHSTRSSSSKRVRLVTLETQHERDADKFASICCENQSLKSPSV